MTSICNHTFLFFLNHIVLHYIHNIRFTIHEHGTYDLPAGLRKCLSVSGRKKVSYIGHSMGTTTFLAMCNDTGMTDHVNMAILLAPVVEPSTMKSPIRHLAPVHQYIAVGLESVGIQASTGDRSEVCHIISSIGWVQPMTVDITQIMLVLVRIYNSDF